MSAKQHACLLRRLNLWAFVALLLSGGCGMAEDHQREVDAWHEDRVAALLAPDGWLSLAGLYWLQPGENTFGSADSNEIVFPHRSLPGYLGSYFVNGDSIRVRLAPDSGVRYRGRSITEMPVQTDASGEPTILERDSLQWYVIDRDGRLALRLKDAQNPARTQFAGIERYPVEAKWRVTGAFRPHPEPKTIHVPTVMNTVEPAPSPGVVEFEVDGVIHRIDAVAEPEAARYWLIFADATNRDVTYPAGRYLYIDAPDEDGTVVIDFNKSYNPPCAFTAYATCPYPPPQNRISAAIEAGEKRYKADERS